MLPFNITVNPSNSGVVREHASSDLTVGVVCEGIENSHKAIAQISARLLVQSFIEQGLYLVFPNAKFFDEAWERVEQDVTSQLYVLAKGMGPLAVQVIKEEFMFTVAGFVATKKFVSVFSIGGSIDVNGNRVYPTTEAPSFGLLMQKFTADKEWRDGFCHFNKEVFHLDCVNSITVGGEKVREAVRAS